MINFILKKLHKAITDITKLERYQDTKPNTVTITSQTLMQIGSKLQNSKVNIKPNENIIPLGKCKLKM